MDIDQAANFLGELYQFMPNGYSEIRCLHGTGNQQLTRRFWRKMPLTAINHNGLRMLEQLNNNGYHIYIRMGISSEQTARKQNIIALPCLWVDVDDDTERGYDAIARMTAIASIITFSGGGWHGYFPLVKPLLVTPDTLPHIEQTLDGMAFECGGDRKCKDITRILRLPGTYNVKPERNHAMCCIADWLPGHFHFNELHDTYAPLGAPLTPRITRHIPREAQTGLPRYVNDYLQSGAVKGERNHTLFVCSRAYNDAGYTENDTIRDLLGRATSDGLTESEALHTIRSAFKYERNPHLPKHMHGLMATEDNLL